MKKRKVPVIAAAVVLVLMGAFWCYTEDYYRADETAIAAMAGSERVSVTQEEGMLVFVPEDAERGLIFYPGGKVEFTAYAPLMLALAEEHTLCVLVEMPFQLAVLDVNAAEGIPERFPQVTDWYLGGHSLGGSMAASYAAENCENLQGLILLAAYSTADLTDSNLRVISLYGSEDGVLNLEKYESYQENLPASTVETVISGGNHGNFGSYGHQEGDGTASLSGAEQIARTAEHLTAFFMNEGK